MDLHKDIFSKIRFRKIPFDKEKAYERLLIRLNREEQTVIQIKSSPVWKYVSIAACFALLLVSGLYVAKLTEKQEVKWYEVTAITNAKTKVVLDDNSTVWMNANAFLRYPETFDFVRTVDAHGSLLFEIQKSEKPFIVQLNGIKIEVLGTSFAVTTGNDYIDITLFEGSVALYKRGNNSSVPDQVLKPSQKARFSMTDNAIRLQTVRVDSYNSWVTGVFRFEGNTLEEITEELYNAFHVKIHIMNEELRNKTFNAEFSNQETLDEILSILQISARYEMTREKGEIYLN
ncbi:MAG: FecR family protein [Tannerellaceae bacterium]|nr:FecR family protein [Tannerellaceae bacterium]